MNSYYLFEKLDELRDLINKNSPFIKNVEVVAEQHYRVGQLLDALEEVTLQGEFRDEGNIQRAYDSIRQEIGQVSPKQFFIGISNLEEAIDNLIQELGENNNPFQGLRTQLESFNEKYEGFFRNYSYLTLVDTVYSASNLIESLETILKFIDSLRDSLFEKFNHGDSCQELTVFLTSGYSCKEFIEKLDSIQVMYSELCLLTNISESEFPLKIVKIESNSLFAKLFGETKAIEILGEVIKDAVSFLYRTYTNEGKIEAISRKAEAIEKVLELNKKLEQAGIDTNESKEAIRKSSVIIADKLNHLLLGEPEIQLNGEFISLDSDLKQKYLEGGRVYLLKGNDAKQEDIEHG